MDIRQMIAAISPSTGHRLFGRRKMAISATRRTAVAYPANQSVRAAPHLERAGRRAAGSTATGGAPSIITPASCVHDDGWIHPLRRSATSPDGQSTLRHRFQRHGRRIPTRTARPALFAARPLRDARASTRSPRYPVRRDGGAWHDRGGSIQRRTDSNVVCSTPPAATTPTTVSARRRPWASVGEGQRREREFGGFVLACGRAMPTGDTLTIDTTAANLVLGTASASMCNTQRPQRRATRRRS